MTTSFFNQTVSQDHAISVGSPAATVTVQNLAGDTVYYGNYGVSALSNLGSLTVGQSVSVTIPQDWIISASYSTVQISTVTAPSTFPSSSFGSGDNLSYSGATTTGQFIQGTQGSASTPDTGLNPLAKYNRTINLQAAAVTGDGGEQAGAVVAEVSGTASNQVQTTALTGIAFNAGTAKGATDSPDACPVYGVGRILSGGIGVGMGGFLRGQADSSTGKLSSLQLQAYNNRGSNDTAVDTGFPNSSAIWIWADGPNTSSQAITIGNPFGRQFDAGLVINADVQGGQTGGVASTGIRIAGTMSKAAISVAQGAGPVILGAATTGFATAQLDVVNNGAADPQVLVRSTASSNVSLQVQNSVSSSTYFAAGSTNAKLTGTAAGDTGIKVNSSSQFFHIGQTISTIKVGGSNTLGFYNVTAVAQPSAVGTATGYTAGATAGTFHTDDTYSGNTGTTSYTINGIVAALKNLGLIHT